ncbi:MAG: hypothetical protein NC828_02970 [Candidatus Omnitrophica bacterium]|nr:hypothetical protein [Candidatus Omnitrophota bacterium]
MKIYKFSLYLIVSTVLALLYVHQQVQLLQISYVIESKERQVTTLLDQNKSLMYNISRLKSPVFLEKEFLTSKKEFNIPQQWNVIEVKSPRLSLQPMTVAKAKKANSLLAFFNIFSKPKEALANTIK